MSSDGEEQAILAAGDKPVHNAVFVQVIHCRQDLPDVAPHFPLLQALLLADPVHQVSSSAELHGHVVAVLRLQSLKQAQELRQSTTDDV